MSKRVTWMFGAVVAMTTGCDEPQASESSCECAEVESRQTQVNGIELNGTRLNGTRLNGTRLNGTRLNGPDGPGEYIELTTIKLQGSGDGESAWLSGGNLHVSAGGGTLSGVQLDSARFSFDLKEGGKGPHKKTLKVLDVEPLAPGSDVWLYDIALKDGPGGWSPLCTDAIGEPTQALLLAEIWEQDTGARMAAAPSDAMTFACRYDALAKCVEWGYRPWASANGQSLRDFHQACTRLVRADYCGDGEPHTTHGTPVHVLDQIGIQTSDPNSQFEVEAEWGPDGAVCLNSANMRLGEQALGCSIPACGAPFASGGLVQSGKIVAGP